MNGFDSLLNDIPIRDMIDSATSLNQVHSILAKRIEQFKIRNIQVKKYLWYGLGIGRILKVGILCNEYIASLEIIYINDSITSKTWDMFKPYTETQSEIEDMTTLLYYDVVIDKPMKDRCSMNVILLDGQSNLSLIPTMRPATTNRNQVINYINESDTHVEFPVGDILKDLLRTPNGIPTFRYYQLCKCLTLLAYKGYWNYWTRNIRGYKFNSDTSVLFGNKYQFGMNEKGIITSMDILEGDSLNVVISARYDKNRNIYYDVRTGNPIEHNAQNLHMIDSLRILESLGLKSLT
jgi:hypothetical protein